MNGITSLSHRCLGRFAIAAVLAAGPAAATAGETSERLGSVPELLAQGYRFGSGGTLSNELTSGVPTTLSQPLQFGNRRYFRGSLFLTKDNDVAICDFIIVTTNPAADPKAAGPISTCYRIK